MQPCLFCSGDASEPDHLLHCDGRQGRVEQFDGETYDAARDHDRLNAQLSRIRAALMDLAWHTLADLERRTGDPQASISARIRDLRKVKFGGAVVERRYVEAGLWEYRLTPALEKAG